MDVCGYGYGCVNVNVADCVSAYGNGNVADCVDMHEKIFLYLLTKQDSHVIMASQNKNVRPLGNLDFVFELMKTISIFEFDF